jgi:hypothetical protein
LDGDTSTTSIQEALRLVWDGGLAQGHTDRGLVSSSVHSANTVISSIDRSS